MNSHKQQVFRILQTIDPYRLQLDSDLESEAERIVAMFGGYWTSVKDSSPLGVSFVVWTANGKTMIVSNRKLDDWLINKYNITHYMILNPPK